MQRHWQCHKSLVPSAVCNDQTFLSNNDPKSLSESTIFYGQFLASKASFLDSDENVDFLEEKDFRF